MNIGSTGANIGIATEAVNVLVDELERQGWRVASWVGASGGAMIATANALGVAHEVQRDWVREMPVDELGAGEHLDLVSAMRAGRVRDVARAMRAVWRGIRSGGFTDGPAIVERFLRERIGRVRFDDPRLRPRPGDPVGSRLVVGVHVGIQDGNELDGAGSRAEQIERARRWMGLRVELGALCGFLGVPVRRGGSAQRVPHVRSVSFPLSSRELVGMGAETEVASTVAATTGRVPFIKGVVAADERSDRVALFFDDASGLHRTLGTDPALRGLDFSRFHEPPRRRDVPTIPEIRVRVGQAGEASRDEMQPRIYDDPDHGIGPVLTITLPPLFKATQFTLTDGDRERSLRFGAALGRELVRSSVVRSFLETFDQRAALHRVRQGLPEPAGAQVLATGPAPTTRPVAAKLSRSAYVALHPDQEHPRQESAITYPWRRDATAAGLVRIEPSLPVELPRVPRPSTASTTAALEAAVANGVRRGFEDAHTRATRDPLTAVLRRARAQRTAWPTDGIQTSFPDGGPSSDAEPTTTSGQRRAGPSDGASLR